MERYLTQWCAARDDFDRRMKAQRTADQRSAMRMEERIFAASWRMAELERKAIADGDLRPLEALRLAVEIASWSAGEDGVASEWSLVQRAISAIEITAAVQLGPEATPRARRPAAQAARRANG